MAAIGYTRLYSNIISSDASKLQHRAQCDTLAEMQRADPNFFSSAIFTEMTPDESEYSDDEGLVMVTAETMVTRFDATLCAKGVGTDFIICARHLDEEGKMALAMLYSSALQTPLENLNAITAKFRDMGYLNPEIFVFGGVSHSDFSCVEHEIEYVNFAREFNITAVCFNQLTFEEFTAREETFEVQFNANGVNYRRCA